MNEKIKEIAEFDGWVYPYKSESEIANAPHLTDLNALHRVALDVMDRLQAFNYYSDMIRNSLTERPINGQYTYLVDAVYEAIVYLKKYEK